MLKFLKKKQFWGALIAIGLLAYCFKDIKLSEIEALSKRLDYFWVLPAVIATFFFQIFRGLRWCIMIRQQTRVPYIQGISLYSAGQVLNIVMPALTGQVGRMILFSRKAGLRKTFVFSTIVLEILFDAISLMIFLFVTSLAFAFPEEYRTVSMVVTGATVFVLILLYLLLTFQARVEAFATRKCRQRWPGFYITIKKFIRSFTKGIDLLRSSQHMFASIGFSLVSWAFHVAVVYFLFLAFGLDLTFGVAAAIMIINTIVLMVPITPGNAGTFEVAVSRSLVAFAGLSSVDVARSDAVLFALALHLMDILPIFVLGMTYVHYQKISLREIREQHEEDSVLDRISEEGMLIEEEQEPHL
jgi:hypothetical protein